MKAHKRAWNKGSVDHINEYQCARPKKAKEAALFLCDTCLKPFANKTKLARHQGSGVARKPKQDAVRTARLTCSSYSKVFAQTANLGGHRDAYLANKSVKDMSCPSCSKVIKNKGKLQMHIASHK